MRTTRAHYFWHGASWLLNTRQTFYASDIMFVIINNHCTQSISKDKRTISCFPCYRIHREESQKDTRNGFGQSGREVTLAPINAADIALLVTGHPHLPSIQHPRGQGARDSTRSADSNQDFICLLTKSCLRNWCCFLCNFYFEFVARQQLSERGDLAFQLLVSHENPLIHLYCHSALRWENDMVI